MKNEFKPGDRVAYSARFLRSICDYSHESASKRGTVTGVKTYGSKCVIVSIDWDEDKDELRAGANAANLVLVSRIAVEAAL